MARHVWTVLCSKASVDQQTNNVSLFEVLEALQIKTSQAPTFPITTPFQGTIVTLWARSEIARGERGEMRVRLLAPDGTQLSEFINRTDLVRTPRTRNIAAITGLPIAGNGVHEFEVAWRSTEAEGWRVVGSVPLDISLAVDPELGTRRA